MAPVVGPGLMVLEFFVLATLGMCFVTLLRLIFLEDIVETQHKFIDLLMREVYPKVTDDARTTEDAFVADGPGD